MTSLVVLSQHAEKVTSRQDLVRFVDLLLMDLEKHTEEWENPTLERYLDALSRVLNDLPGRYRNQGQTTPESPTWRLIGEALLTARIYE